MTRWCLVVEDERILGEMICDNLQAEGLGTELITDGSEALSRLARGGLDLVILDVMLPGADGFEVLQTMRARGDQTPVLILSARDQDKDRIRGLELRADDYLTKPFNLRELMLRVRALLRRTSNVDNAADVLACGPHEIHFRTHQVLREGSGPTALSDTEVRLLRFMANRAGEVLHRRELLDHLFGPASLSSSRTLDNVVMNLRRVLGEDSKNPRYLHTVRGVGFRFTPDAADGAEAP